MEMYRKRMKPHKTLVRSMQNDCEGLQNIVDHTAGIFAKPKVQTYLVDLAPIVPYIPFICLKISTICFTPVAPTGCPKPINPPPIDTIMSLIRLDCLEEKPCFKYKFLCLQHVKVKY